MGRYNREVPANLVMLDSTADLPALKVPKLQIMHVKPRKKATAPVKRSLLEPKLPFDLGLYEREVGGGHGGQTVNHHMLSCQNRIAVDSGTSNPDVLTGTLLRAVRTVRPEFPGCRVASCASR